MREEPGNGTTELKIGLFDRGEDGDYSVVGYVDISEHHCYAGHILRWVGTTWQSMGS